MKNLLANMDELSIVSKILREDELKCMKNAVKDKNQFWRRMYVRSFFAHVEGVAYRLKQLSLSAAKSFHIELTQNEISRINEESYELTDNAQIERKLIFSSIDKNIKFTFRVAQKAHGTKLDLNLGSDKRWVYFKKSINIRNKITHPKNSDDLIISDKELMNLLNAVQWFAGTLDLLINTIKEAVILTTKK